MAITATKPTSDEDWYKFLNLSANSANSTNLAETNKDYGPYIQNLGTIKNITPTYDRNFSKAMNLGATINPDLFNIRTGAATQDYDSTQAKGGLFGKGWVTNENLLGFNSLMSGFGSAAKGWAALKTLGMTEQAYADVNTRFRENMDAMKTTTNNSINQTNAWLKAQGRTDFHKNV